jgi:hypothetical protein
MLGRSRLVVIVPVLVVDVLVDGVGDGLVRAST